MGLGIAFYVSAKNSQDEEVRIGEYCKEFEGKNSIYTINASDVCSAFIAKYFCKVDSLPKGLLHDYIEENHNETNNQKVKHELCNGIYKAKLDVINADEECDYKFDKDNYSENVRTELMRRYNIVKDKLEGDAGKAKLDIYATFVV